jgi:hypothetical protein
MICAAFHLDIRMSAGGGETSWNEKHEHENVSKNCRKVTLSEYKPVFDRQTYTVSRKRPLISTSCPCDSFVVPELKNYLKGTHFPQVRKIRKSATQLLHALSQNEVSECCEGWKARLARCLPSDGSAFKGMTCK